MTSMNTSTVNKSTKVRNAIVGLASLAVVGLALGHTAPGSVVSTVAPKSQTVAVVTTSAHVGGNSAYLCGHLSVCGK